MENIRKNIKCGFLCFLGQKGDFSAFRHWKFSVYRCPVLIILRHFNIQCATLCIKKNK